MHNKTTPDEKKIQWHPGFCAATELELRKNRNELEFHREYNLSKKPLQIVVIRELKPIEHPSLRILAKKITESDIRNFAECVNRLTEPGDRQNADAVLQVSVLAKQETYREARSDINMNALRELFKDELEDKYKEGELKGESRINLLYTRLKKDGRQEDILRAIEDPELCQKFFVEYGMK